MDIFYSKIICQPWFPADRLIDWVIDLLTADWLIDWFVESGLIDWLIDWLAQKYSGLTFKHLLRDTAHNSELR